MHHPPAGVPRATTAAGRPQAHAVPTHVATAPHVATGGMLPARVTSVPRALPAGVRPVLQAPVTTAPHSAPAGMQLGHARTGQPPPTGVTQGRAAPLHYAPMGQRPARTVPATAPHAMPEHHVAPGLAPLQPTMQVPPATLAGTPPTPQVPEAPAPGVVPVGLQPTQVTGELYGGSCSCATEGQSLRTTLTFGKLPPPPVLLGLPPASPLPPARVVIVCALKDGVEALSNICAHGTRPNTQAACVGHGLSDILFQLEEVV